MSPPSGIRVFRSSKSSVLALYLNGGFVADMDMEAPKDGGSFGLYAQSARQQRSEWRVLSFSATPLPLEPSGRYKVTGTAGGSSYEGTVTVEETGDSYAVVWSIDKQSIKGTGVLRGATFSVAYRSAGKTELATYGPAGIDWSGKRTRSEGGAGRHRDLAATAAIAIAGLAVADDAQQEPTMNATRLAPWLAASLTVQVLATQSASGCAATAGATFRDDFKSPSPQWSIDGNHSYFIDGQLALKPEPNGVTSVMVRDFEPQEGNVLRRYEVARGPEYGSERRPSILANRPALFHRRCPSQWHL